MTKYISILVILFVQISQAQVKKDYSVKVYDEFKTAKREIPEQYVGSNDKGHYFVYYDGKDSYLVKYNNNFIPTPQRIPLTRNKGNVKEHSLDVIQVDNKLYNITVKSSNDLRIYYCKVIDIDNLSTSSEKEIARQAFGRGNFNNSYESVIKSLDNNFFGFFYNVPNISQSGVSYELIVLDKEFNQIKKNVYHFPNDKNSFSIEEGLLLNDKEMIVLTENYTELRNSNNSQYGLFLLKENNSEFIGEVPNNNKWLNSGRLEVNKESIKVIGFYSNIDKYNFHGTYFYKVNRENYTKTTLKFSPNSKELLQKHYNLKNNKFIKKNTIERNRELSNYIMDGVYTNVDNTYLIYAEQRFTTSIMINNNYIENINCGNIVAFLLDDEGNQLWSRMIKKNNSDRNSRIHTSYTLSTLTDSYTFIYTGNYNNLNERDNNLYSTFAIGQKPYESILAVKLYKNGDIKKDIVINSSGINNFRIRPKLSSIISQGELLLFAHKPTNLKKQLFVKIKFEE